MENFWLIAFSILQMVSIIPEEKSVVIFIIVSHMQDFLKKIVYLLI